MNKSLKIDGKIYISSSRAAEISKYSKDYIGQLCRKGEVVAQMVGRAWYVDQESLFEHKKNAEIKYLPPYLMTKMEIVIYKDKAFIVIWTKSPVGFLIQNEEAMKSFKTYFEALWKIAKK